MHSDRFTMKLVKEANVQYFAKGNSRFFGDLRYGIYKNKAGKAFMVRSTTMWSDMFGQPKRTVYRVNPINSETLKVEDLVDEIFPTLGHAQRWVRNQS